MAKLVLPLALGNLDAQNKHMLGIILVQRADEGPVFDAGDITGVGTRQETVGPLLWIQPDEGARRDLN
jgi:hypothetical protein